MEHVRGARRLKRLLSCPACNVQPIGISAALHIGRLAMDTTRMPHHQYQSCPAMNPTPAVPLPPRWLLTQQLRPPPPASLLPSRRTF